MGIAFERGVDDQVMAVTLRLGEHALRASQARRT
jgi:hypothetical protein